MNIDHLLWKDHLGLLSALKSRFTQLEVKSVRLPPIDCVWNNHWSVRVLDRQWASLIDRSQPEAPDRVCQRYPEISDEKKHEARRLTCVRITFSRSIKLGGRTGGATDVRRPVRVGRRS